MALQSQSIRAGLGCAQEPTIVVEPARKAMMTESRSGVHVADGDGEAWWFLATRMRILADSTLTGGALTLLLQDSPAGFGPPLHVHDAEDEAFFVLDGAMHIECGDQQWEAGPGSFTWLPRAVAHRFIVTRPGRMLQLTTPAGFESFVADVGTRAVGPGLPPPTEPDLTRLARGAASHGTSLLGPPLDPAAFGIER